MDGRDFDRLVVALAEGRSRRSILKALAASVLGLAAGGITRNASAASCSTDSDCSDCEYCWDRTCQPCHAGGAACRDSACVVVPCTSGDPENVCYPWEVCCDHGGQGSSCTLGTCCFNSDCRGCQACQANAEGGRTCVGGCDPQECCTDDAGAEFCADCCDDSHCPSSPTECGISRCIQNSCTTVQDDSQCEDCETCDTGFSCQTTLKQGEICCDDTPVAGNCCTTSMCGACEQCINHICTPDCEEGKTVCCSVLGAGTSCVECCEDIHCAGNPNGPTCQLDNTCGGCASSEECGNGLVCCEGACCAESNCCDGGCCEHGECCGGTCCLAGQVCMTGESPVCCTRKSCAVDYPGQCGDQSDGCGGTINCGCASGSKCCDGVCSECCASRDCDNGPCGVCNAGVCDYGCQTGECCCKDGTCSAGCCAAPVCKADHDCSSGTCCCKDGTCSATCCAAPACKADHDCGKGACCCKDGTCSSACCAAPVCKADHDCGKGACCCKDGSCNASCCTVTQLPSTGTGPGDESSPVTPILAAAAAALIGAKVLRKHAETPPAPEE